MNDGMKTRGKGGKSTKTAQVERQMRELVNFNLDGILVIGMDGIALFANPAACSLLNRPLESILDQEIGLPLSGEDYTEIEIHRPDGTSRTVEMRAHRIEWAGQPAWLADLRDITERKQAEKKLDAERRFSQAVIDALSSNLCVLDEEGVIISVNKAWKGFAEANPPAPANYALGVNYLAVCDQADGENSEEAQPFANGLRSVLRGERATFHLEYPCHDPGGEERWFNAHVTRFQTDEALRVVVSHENITPRILAEKSLRQSEEKMSSIFRVAPTGIGVVRDRVLQDVNERICEMTGYTKGELIGQSAKTLYPTQEDFDFVGREKYRQIAEGGTGQVETRWLKKDGTIIDILLASTPLDVDDLLKGVTFTALDITERKRVADALRQSEDKFKYVFDNSTVAKSITKIDGRLHTNRAFCEMVGYSAAELENKPWREITHPEDVELNLREVNEILAGKKESARFIKRYIHKNGSVVWVDLSTSLRRDADGNPLYFITTALDITERKRAEEQQQLLLSIIERSRDFIGVASMDQRAIYVNPAGQAMVGLDGDEAAKATKIEDYFFPEDLPFVNETILPTLMREGRWVGEFRFRHFKTGNPISIHYDLFRTENPSTGEIINYSTVSRDITDLKRAEDALRQSEERFELAMLAVNDGIWDWDIANDRVYFDQRYYTMAGYKPNEFPSAFDEWSKRVHPDDIEHSMKTVNEHLAGQTKVFDIEFRFLRKDGTWMWIRGRGKAVKHDANGKVSRMIGTHTDITDRKRVEEALRQAAHEWRTTFDATNDAIWVLDREHRIRRSNKTSEQIFQYPLENMMGRHCWEIIHGTTTPIPECPVLQAKRSLRRERMELAIGAKWYEVTADPILDTDGKFDGSVHIISDITDRKKAGEAILQSERQMKALLTSLDDIVFEFDRNGNYLNIWAADESLLAMPKAQMLGRNVLEVMGIEHGTPFDHAIKRSLAGNIPQSIEYPLEVIGGKRWFMARVSPILSPDGSTHTVSVLVRDITERKRIEEQVQVQLQRMRALNEIDRAISASLDMRLSLDILLSHTLTQLEVDTACILLLNSSSQTLEYMTGKGFRSKTIRESRVRLGQGLPGRAGLERKTMHVPDIKTEEENFIRKKLLQEEGFVEYFCVPLIAKGMLKGVLEIFNRTPLDANVEWLDYLETLGGQAAIAIDNAQLFEGMQRSNMDLITAYDATIEGWSRAMDLRDKETEGHTLRVTEGTVKLAKAMGVSQQEITHMRRGALLHDIGKLGVPDHILHKTGELDRIEWAIMRQHPTYAFNMLMPIHYLRPALDIPYCHHEKWDGTGYPRGLKGGEIPLAARIFAIVDVWDALRSDRPYRQGWTNEKIREHLLAESGRHFDPQVADAFLKMLEEDEP